MSRLEEIKAQYHLLTRNGYDLGAWDEPFSWLIEQAKRAQELEQKLHFCEMTKLSMDSVEKYTEQIKSKNKRYREALEFYADRDNYKLEHFDPNLNDYMSTVDYDEGMKARRALEGEE